MSNLSGNSAVFWTIEYTITIANECHIIGIGWTVLANTLIFNS